MNKNIKNLLSQNEIDRYKFIYKHINDNNDFRELLNLDKYHTNYSKEIDRLITKSNCIESNHEMDDWGVIGLLFISEYKYKKGKTVQYMYEKKSPFFSIWVLIRKNVENMLNIFTNADNKISIKCLKDMTDELYRELSKILEFTLYDTFLNTIPFGYKLAYIYSQETCMNELIESQYYQKFLEEIDTEFYLKLFEEYPVALYLLSITVLKWLIRSKELLVRINLDKCLLENFLDVQKIIAIGEVKSYNSDLHNQGRRTYIVGLVSDDGALNRVCYKPRSMMPDKFLFDFSHQIRTRNDKIRIRAAKFIDCQSYGYTEFIDTKSEFDGTNQINSKKIGELLFYLWILGANDCSKDNILFDGLDYVLIDCESLFQGSWILGNDRFNNYDLDELYYNSVIRTMMIPTWSLSEDKDNLNDDKSFIGNINDKTGRLTKTWDNSISNKNYITLIKEGQDNEKTKRCLINEIQLNNFIVNVKLGFSAASRYSSEIFECLIMLIDDKYSNLKSSFIFRGTSLYKKLQSKLYTPEACSDIRNFIEILKNLSLVKYTYKNAPVIVWISDQEINQLFMLDIPSFSADIKTAQISTHNSSNFDAIKVYRNAYEQIYFTKKIIKENSISFQLFIIENGIKSRFMCNKAIYNIPTILKKYPINNIFHSNHKNIWASWLLSSFIKTSSIKKTQLVNLESGYSRKEIQVSPLDCSLFKGYTGIILVNSFSGCHKNLNDDMLKLENYIIEHTVLNNNRSVPRYGLSGYSGIVLGLYCKYLFENKNYYKSTKIIDAYHSYLQNLDLGRLNSPNIEIGLGGILLTLLSIEKIKGSNFDYSKIVHKFLTFQNNDGSWKQNCFEESKHLERGLLEGVDGILLTLCKIYELNTSYEIKEVIIKTIESLNIKEQINYGLTKSCDYSWGYGLSGNLICIARCIALGITSPSAISYMENLIKAITDENIIDDHSVINGKMGRIITLQYINYLFKYKSLIPSINSLTREVIEYINDNGSVKVTRNPVNFLLSPSLGLGYSSIPSIDFIIKKNINPFMWFISFDESIIDVTRNQEDMQL